MQFCIVNAKLRNENLTTKNISKENIYFKVKFKKIFSF